MKRTLLLILALCLLLTGCGVPGEADTQSSGAKEAVLLDSCEAFDDSGALWYIPNQQIEAQQYPMLRTFADNLLMTTSSYISDGNSELKLTLLSATTGEALQSCTVGAYRICRTTDSRGSHCRMRQSVWNGRRAGCAPSGDRTLHSFRRSGAMVPWL